MVKIHFPAHLVTAGAAEDGATADLCFNGEVVATFREDRWIHDDPSRADDVTPAITHATVRAGFLKNDRAVVVLNHPWRPLLTPEELAPEAELWAFLGVEPPPMETQEIEVGAAWGDLWALKFPQRPALWWVFGENNWS